MSWHNFFFKNYNSNLEIKITYVTTKTKKYKTCYCRDIEAWLFYYIFTGKLQPLQDIKQT